MAEPIWLTRLVVDVIHAELIAEHGGSTGAREGGDDLIEAAVARPRQKLAYEPRSDMPDLAAAYLFGLVKNHGYVDGNKRVAFAATATFLLVNNIQLTATEQQAYDVVFAAAEGRMTEVEIASWIRENARPRSVSP